MDGILGEGWMTQCLTNYLSVMTGMTRATLKKPVVEVAAFNGRI